MRINDRLRVEYPVTIVPRANPPSQVLDKKKDEGQPTYEGRKENNYKLNGLDVIA